jgi:hypothetical protein
MQRFKIIENKTEKSYYVIDGLSGACLLETENPETARRKAERLNQEDALV